MIAEQMRCPSCLGHTFFVYRREVGGMMMVCTACGSLGSPPEVKP